MKRDWKPGDVAMVRSRKYPDEIPDEPRILGGADGARWWGTTGFLRDEDAEIVRPLVVIDPEDREQVERLLHRYHSWKWTADIANASITDMQDALREFANPTPPKPDEPRGLYAVVEDDRAVEWVRANRSGVAPWKCLTNDRWFDYEDISVVHVLSEGVTP